MNFWDDDDDEELFDKINKVIGRYKQDDKGSGHLKHPAPGTSSTGAKLSGPVPRCSGSTPVPKPICHDHAHNAVSNNVSTAPPSGVVPTKMREGPLSYNGSGNSNHPSNHPGGKRSIPNLANDPSLDRDSSSPVRVNPSSPPNFTWRPHQEQRHPTKQLQPPARTQTNQPSFGQPSASQAFQPLRENSPSLRPAAAGMPPQAIQPIHRLDSGVPGHPSPEPSSYRGRFSSSGPTDDSMTTTFLTRQDESPAEFGHGSRPGSESILSYRTSNQSSPIAPPQNPTSHLGVPGSGGSQSLRSESHGSGSFQIHVSPSSESCIVTGRGWAPDPAPDSRRTSGVGSGVSSSQSSLNVGVERVSQRLDFDRRSDASTRLGAAPDPAPVGGFKNGYNNNVSSTANDSVAAFVATGDNNKAFNGNRQNASNNNNNNTGTIASNAGFVPCNFPANNVSGGYLNACNYSNTGISNNKYHGGRGANDGGGGAELGNNVPGQQPLHGLDPQASSPLLPGNNNPDVGSRPLLPFPSPRTGASKEPYSQQPRPYNNASFGGLGDPAGGPCEIHLSRNSLNPQPYQSAAHVEKDRPCPQNPNFGSGPGSGIQPNPPPPFQGRGAPEPLGSGGGPSYERSFLCCSDSFMQNGAGRVAGAVVHDSNRGGLPSASASVSASVSAFSGVSCPEIRPPLSQASKAEVSPVTGADQGKHPFDQYRHDSHSHPPAPFLAQGDHDVSCGHHGSSLNASALNARMNDSSTMKSSKNGGGGFGNGNGNNNGKGAVGAGVVAKSTKVVTSASGRVLSVPMPMLDPAGFGHETGIMTYTAILTVEKDRTFSLKIGYHDAVEALLRSMPGGSMCQTTRIWFFPLDMFSTVRSQLSALPGFRIIWAGLPDMVVSYLEAACTCEDDSALYDSTVRRRSNPMEPSLDEQMMAFQRAGVQFGLRRGGRVLIGDEMGLGKTVQACCLLECYRHEWPVLILSPSSLREQWADALNQWIKLTDDDVLVVFKKEDIDRILVPVSGTADDMDDEGADSATHLSSSSNPDPSKIGSYQSQLLARRKKGACRGGASFASSPFLDPNASDPDDSDAGDAPASTGKVGKAGKTNAASSMPKSKLSSGGSQVGGRGRGKAGSGSGSGSGPFGDSAVRPRYKVTILGYDWVDRAKDVLHRAAFQVVVLDEAHFIKSLQAKRTKACLPLLAAAKRAVLLTGTPALSRPIELLPLMQGLLPAAKLKVGDFCERYCAGDRFSRYRGVRNEMELNRLLSGTLMIRRRKSEVLTQLPVKRRQQVYLRLGEAEMAKLNAMSAELRAVRKIFAAHHRHGGPLGGIGGSGGGSGGGGMAAEFEQKRMLNEMYAASAVLKAKAVQDYVGDLLESSDQKFLVFAHHKALLDAVEAKLRDARADHIRIDGDTPPQSRLSLVKRFQEEERVRVAVLGIRAAGTGLTLTASSLVVFAELTWIPGEVQQAEDRVHRIGQSRGVLVQFLMVRGSIDEIIWDAIQNKLDGVGKVLDGTGDSLKVNSTKHVREAGQNSLTSFLSQRPGAANPSSNDPFFPSQPKSQLPSQSLALATQQRTTSFSTSGSSSPATATAPGFPPDPSPPPPRGGGDRAGDDSKKFKDCHSSKGNRIHSFFQPKASPSQRTATGSGPSGSDEAQPEAASSADESSAVQKKSRGKSHGEDKFQDSRCVSSATTSTGAYGAEETSRTSGGLDGLGTAVFMRNLDSSVPVGSNMNQASMTSARTLSTVVRRPTGFLEFDDDEDDDDDFGEVFKEYVTNSNSNVQEKKCTGASNYLVGGDHRANGASGGDNSGRLYPSSQCHSKMNQEEEIHEHHESIHARKRRAMDEDDQKLDCAQGVKRSFQPLN